MSENRQVLVIRKSIAGERSSFPRGASSRQTTSFGRGSGGVSSAVTAWSVPSRCRSRYSMPFTDEANRFARQTVSTRGQFAGSSGSSPANRSLPAFSWSTT